MKPIISLSIEGDYTDSFIYSGTLFLVSSNDKLITYDYEKLIDFLIDSTSKCDTEKSQLRQVLKDCREEIEWTIDNPVELFINQSFLRNFEINSKQFNSSPVDINVYSNKVYIANEMGAFCSSLNYRKHSIDDSFVPIWKKYTFKVSPNNFSRVALASGDEGIVLIFSSSIITNQKVKILTKEPSNDCEWIGNNLSINTQSKTLLSVFQEISGIPPDLKKWDAKKQQEYWSVVEEKKHIDPQIIESDNRYLWVSGKQIFAITNSGHLSKLEVSKDEPKLNKTIQSETPICNIDTKILSARSTIFGSIIETYKTLLLYSDQGVETLSSSFANWRVFPRAKNYINHLHIVEDDRLCIFIYPLQNDSKISNAYSIKMDDVI